VLQRLQKDPWTLLVFKDHFSGVAVLDLIKAGIILRFLRKAHIDY
jgi:hypothetical protein